MKNLPAKYIKNARTLVLEYVHARLPRNAVYTLLFSLAFLACSETIDKKELEPKELKPKDLKVSESSERDLMQEAQTHFSNGLYTIAKENFQTLLNTYPDGVYKEYAELKIADTDFEMMDYGEAVKEFENFQQNHPASTSSDYVALRIGRCYHLMHKGVGRDPTPLQRAIEGYNQLINKFPNSLYTPTAKQYLSEANKLLAEQEKFVSDFYANGSKETAANVREREYNKRLKVAQQEEKNQIPDNKYEGKISDEKELTAPTLVGAQELPDKRKQAVQSKAMQNTESLAAYLKSTANSTDTNSEDSDNLPSITKIECNEIGGASLLIYTSKKISDDFVDENSQIKTQNGILSLQLPVTAPETIFSSCFSPKDLVITNEGYLSLNGVRSAKLLSLSAPPRLLIIAN